MRQSLKYYKATGPWLCFLSGVWLTGYSNGGSPVEGAIKAAADAFLGGLQDTELTLITTG